MSVKNLNQESRFQKADLIFWKNLLVIIATVQRQQKDFTWKKRMLTLQGHPCSLRRKFLNHST